MTTTEMISEFGIRYTSEINLAVPGWETDEILSFLNNAQLYITDELFTQLGESPLQELIKFELVPEIPPADIGSKPVKNSQYFQQDYGTTWRHIVSVHCTFTRTDITSEVDNKTEVNPIDMVALQNLIETAYNKPWFRELYYYLSNEDPNYTGAPLQNENKLIVVRDTYTTITSTESRFIKEPDKLVEPITTPVPGAGETYTSELHEKYHNIIVDRAVTLAIEALMNPRIQTQPKIIQQ